MVSTGLRLATFIAPLLIVACVDSGLNFGKSDPAATPNSSSPNGLKSQLEHCETPLGKIILVENKSSNWYSTLTDQYHLPPTTHLLRLMIQQSNCFVVIDANDATMAQDAIQTHSKSKLAKNAITSSDYALSPEVIFNDENTNGVSGAFGGLLGGLAGNAIASVGLGSQSNQTKTMLTMVDERSGTQIAAVQGSASKTDFVGFGSLFSEHNNSSRSQNGYQSTAQGKVIAAAFMQSYNGIVRSTRDYKQQMQTSLDKPRPKTTN